MGDLKEENPKEKMLASNGKLFSFDRIDPARKKVSIKHTILDVVMFLLTSLCYIIQVSDDG